MEPTTALAHPPDRLHQVFTWILDGATEHEITETIAAQWPDESPKPLIVAAMERIADSASADPATVRGFCVEAIRHVYHKAIEAGDLATALRAIKQLQDFAG